jgi:hypothetical protein
VLLNNGQSSVGLRKPLDKQLGGLEQFDLFFSFFSWACVPRKWANSLVVLSMVSVGGL